LTQHFGEGLEVEFGTQDGGSARAWTPIDALTAVFRSDLGDLLSDSDQEKALNPAALLSVINLPNRLIELKDLKLLFSQFFIPIQVADKRDLVVFNVGNLSALGNP
jgi:hypothetical protein